MLVSVASMGPPREHGGMVSERGSCFAAVDGASMGPPREHGGMLREQGLVRWRHVKLQWGRRVNTAECRHGCSVSQACRLLQWGRRVNTAECEASPVDLARAGTRFNGAAA